MPIKLTDIENDHFLVKFASRTHYIAALTEGPWIIFGHYITVESWSPDFDPSQDHPSRIMAWVRLPGLPITWYKQSLIEAIGSCIGSVVKIDYQTNNGRRGRFARMAVKINLRQPLVSKIIVNGRTQIVEYESLPIVCFSCGTYGHANHNCPQDKPVESAMDFDLPQPINPPNQQPVESYGPWMLVARRRRRPALSRLPPNPVVENSRYNPIFLETDNDNLPPTADNTPSAPSSPHRSNSTLRQVPIVQNQVVLPASPPVIPGSVPTERVQDSDTRSHSSKARTKGKSPISLRKSAPIVLGSRDMNIMIRKPTSGASSSKRSSKARSQPSNLNPTKHSAVVLYESAPPVTMLQLQQKQADHSASPIDNSKSLTRTNSAPPLNNSVSVSQEPLGHLAMADCYFIRTTKQYVRDHQPDICVFRKGFQAVFGFVGLIMSKSRFYPVTFSSFIAVSVCPDLQIVLLPLLFTPAPLEGIVMIYGSTLNHSLALSLVHGLFLDMVLHCGLHDLGYSGPHFTWSRGSRSARLDRSFGNSLWFERYPHFFLHHLLRMKSDHRPIFLTSNDHSIPRRDRDFKYFSCWSLHPDFKRLVRESWDSISPITDSIKLFSEAATKWNVEVFGSIQRHKRIIMARLRGVQRCLDQRRTSNMLKLEAKLLNELETVLVQEELLWKHKARVDWINFNDRNTSFFHSKAKFRTRRKAVMSLMVDNGDWCTDHSILRDAATSFFRGLFDTDTDIDSPPPFSISAKFCCHSLRFMGSESTLPYASAVCSMPLRWCYSTAR
ncbi:hypothetical protein GQ457_18G010960 [Hibiscus cannabinus]